MERSTTSHVKISDAKGTYLFMFLSRGGRSLIEGKYENVEVCKQSKLRHFILNFVVYVYKPEPTNISRNSIDFKKLRCPWKQPFFRLGTFPEKVFVEDHFQRPKFHACVKKCTNSPEISS